MSHKYFKEYLNHVENFGVEKILGIGNTGIRNKLKELDLADNIEFSQFLSQRAFIKYNTKKLCEQIDDAQNNDIRVIKMFFGPRFLTFTRRKIPYRINDERLDPVYSLIEDYGMKILIHVADPDVWYQKRYKNTAKYGTKEERIEDFSNLLERYPKIDMISAHLGSLPENLIKLGELFDPHPHLYVDTSSTKWMVRELGKNVSKTKNWIEKYQNRLLWGCDIMNIQLNLKFFLKEEQRKFYWSSRYWSHRIFWETSHQAPLAFKDSDNPDGTVINGLNLPHSTLKKIYYENANDLFRN